MGDGYQLYLIHSNGRITKYIKGLLMSEAEKRLALDYGHYIIIPREIFFIYKNKEFVIAHIWKMADGSIKIGEEVNLPVKQIMRMLELLETD